MNVREAPKKISFSLGAQRIKMRDIVIFTRQFSTMINAGLPLVQALDILAKQTENKALRDVTRAVVFDVESGHTLADALRKHPKAFTDLYVNMVAAGEAGGILDTILMRLATFMEKNDALVRKVKGAMIYPGVIMSVAGIAIAVLLIFVIPTFENMFASAGMALPLPTRIVIGMSNVPDQLLVDRDPGDRRRDLRDPAVLQHVERPAADRRPAAQGAGARRRAPEVGGVALHPDAGHAGQLGRVASSTASRSRRRRRATASSTTRSWSRAQSIAGGETIAAPLKKSKVFPPMVISMIAVGEQTGGLDEMLSKIADFYDEEVDAAVSALLSLMEPVMIVFLGVVVGGMVVAMYLPIFDMINAVQ